MGTNSSQQNPPSGKQSKGKDAGKESSVFFPPALGIGQKSQKRKPKPRAPSVRKKSSSIIPSVLAFGRKSLTTTSVGRRGSSTRSVGRRGSSTRSVSRRGSSTRSVSRRGSSIPRPKNVYRRSASVISSTVAFGRQEATLRARLFHPYDSHTMTKPTVKKGMLWKDNKFPFTIDQDKKDKPVKISWKRPTEYVHGCRLFGDTINRYSVKQGQIGDCFFISTLSAMADKPKFFNQIMPRDAYETEPGRYSGIFHCRFWWMGEWIDVYTDDLLPFNEKTGKVYGGRSDERKVVWVPLMEKALARLCGSYRAVLGDQSHAYSLMTGGVVDKLKIRKRDAKDEIPPPQTVFARIKHALNSGSLVLTSIDQNESSNPNLKGLTSNHSYAIHDAIKVKHRKKNVKLLKIRNPWGETNKLKPVHENGEWKGRWSYGSSEWREVRKDLRKRHNVDFEKGGEFWVCMEDFYKIFEHIYIADTIPNFGEKGFRKSDQLNNVFNILGDWHGETAAGSDWRTLFNNPRFVLIIPNKGLNADNRMPAVIQLILQHEHPVRDTENKDHLYCRIDIFLDEAEEYHDKRLHMSLTAISVSEVYLASRENTRLHRLRPGKYILVPNFLDEEKKRRISQAFCIRVFTATPVKCRELMDDSIALTGKPNETFENDDASPKKQFRTINLIGEWKGETAAGSDSVTRFNNPRYLLNVPGSGKVKVCFQLRPRRDIDATLHCRLDVFQIDENLTWRKGKWTVMAQITNMVTFMAGGEVSYDYELKSGKYLLLPNYSGRERIPSAFCIRILAETHIECNPLIQRPVIFMRTADSAFNHEGKNYDLGRLNCLFGEWVKNKTAGGQIRYETFSKNPQFALTVKGKEAQPFLIELSQECVQPIYAIGCFVIKSVEEQNAPLDNKALRHGTRVNTVEGKTHSFIQSSQSAGYYMLNPGRYVILVFADQPTDEKKFALIVSYQATIKHDLSESKR